MIKFSITVLMQQNDTDDNINHRCNFLELSLITMSKIETFHSNISQNIRIFFCKSEIQKAPIGLTSSLPWELP